MSENLKKVPPKGILKQSSSFDHHHQSPRCSITSLTSHHSEGGAITSSSTGGLTNEEDEGIQEEEDDSVAAAAASSSSQRKKSAKFDEMNILETLHPPDKDYGFMRIDEPKTPFNYYEEEGEGGEEGSGSVRSKKGEILLDPAELAEKIKEKGLEEPSFLKSSSEGGGRGGDDDEEEEECPTENRREFESKRKAHYNEYFAVKLARQLMEKEDSEDEEEGQKKFIPEEEL